MPVDDSSQGPTTADTGRTGEDAAAGYLKYKGCTILARNWRASPGEVDIVAECHVNCAPCLPKGSQNLSACPCQSVLAFVEVRTRHGGTGLAEESISRRKAANMVAAAYAYMASQNFNPDTTPWRIDLVAISMSGPNITAINWIQGAIDEEMLGM